MENVLVIENVQELIENDDVYGLGYDVLGSIVENIANNLENAVSRNSYDDMSYYVTETENYNGSWYCSTYVAKNEVLENWDTFGKLLDDYENEYGMKLDINPFDEIEKLHCVLMIFASTRIFDDFKFKKLTSIEYVNVLDVSYDSNKDTLTITYEE